MHFKVEIEYAIRMVDYLARRKEIAGAAEIAEKVRVPLRFAKKILQKLAETGIISSYRGVRGGYQFKKEVNEISLYDVFVVIDGPLILKRNISRSEEYLATVDQYILFQEVFEEMLQDMKERMRRIKFV